MKLAKGGILKVPFKMGKDALGGRLPDAAHTVTIPALNYLLNCTRLRVKD